MLSEVRPNPGNDKGACCEICGAVLVCLSCGNHHEHTQPSPGEGRQEQKFPVDGCNCSRNIPYQDWSHAKDCPLYFPMPQPPVSPQDDSGSQR